MNEEYMKVALKEAVKSLKNEDIPVGAVIVKNGEVVAKAHNRCNKNHTIHEHAEIICINEAIRKIGDSYLDDCILYITMEPCLMCFGAIEKTNIKKIVYGISNEKMGFSKFINYMPSKETEQNICSIEIKEMMNNFFKNKRN